MQAIGIAGTGRLAQALGRLLVEAGEPVAAIAGRNQERTRAAAAFVGARAATFSELPALASRLLVVVSDDALEQVAATLAAAGMRDGVALHTSGARGPEALKPLAEAGVCCGALHPLQTIPSPEAGVKALRGIAFGVTAEGAAAAWAEHIVRVAGGWMLRIPAEMRATYHAAGVMASNFVTALVDGAAMLMRMAGIAESDALRALAPLLKTAVETTLALGPVAALTGPIQRGDRDTVALHWAATAAAPPTVRQLYKAGSLHLIELAQRRGLAPEMAQQLRRIYQRG